MKSQFQEKLLLIEKFPSVVLSTNAITLQHLIQFPLYYLPSGRLREIKNKREFQTSGSESGRGRLREVVAEERWSLIRGSKHSDI